MRIASLLFAKKIIIDVSGKLEFILCVFVYSWYSVGGMALP